MRVAIVGGGPRGVFAAARLLAHARQEGARFVLDVFDPAPPGHGAAYNPGQPDYLRLNVRSSIVDAGWHEGPAPSPSWLCSFDAWRAARGETQPLEPFPPRALAGRYLAGVWADAVAHAPSGCVARHVPARVAQLRARPGGWLVDGAPYDEVLLVTGHADDWPGALRHGWSAPQPLVPAVFPVDEHLGTDVIAAGARVAVRGAALTFIDAALALTEGRGGRFVEADGRLGYQPSGAEPGVLWPVSRHGRWMEVKPQPGSATQRLPLDALRQAGLAAVRDAGNESDALAAVRRTAHAYLQAADGDDHAGVDAAFDGTPHGDPTEALRRSVAVALGEARPHGPWALGQAWRDLYPALVRRFSGTADGSPQFAETSRRLEGIAFGPPPVNGRKLLALIDAGVIDPAGLGAATIDTAGLHWPGHEADVVIDAVLPPPGVAAGAATLPGRLALAGEVATVPERRGIAIDADGTCLDEHGHRRDGLAAAGRPTEDVVVGNDTLDPRLHDVVERWASRVAGRAAARQALRRGVRGEPPLTGRLEPWMEELLSDPDGCAALLDEHDSPVNVLDPGPLTRNAAELVDAGAAAGVEVGVHFARKANKALCFVTRALAEGHGVDVSSLAELRQALAAGMPGERVLLTAAVKPDPLLAEAVAAGVIVSLDSRDELARVAAAAQAAGKTATVMPRVAPEPASGLRPSRFGEPASAWVAAGFPPHVRALGVHAHLDGYAIADRLAVLSDCLVVADALGSSAHPVEFVDLGGGVPMSYLDDRAEWEAFWAAARDTADERLLWRDRPVTTVYPYWQRPVRGEWLAALLAEPLGEGTVAAALRERGLRLHLEPGRSLLDGCGLTLARVAFTKRRSDGVGLVGLEMNRTQCRSTSDDFLVDPVLVRRTPPGPATDAFLVGAYCIEDELILNRRLRFAEGVAAGDIVALVNTAGYLMHILESASHQIPLARNVVRDPAGPFVLDRLDRPDFP